MIMMQQTTHGGQSFPFVLNGAGKILTAQQPLVMAILNVTHDSFYAGSRFNQADTALQQAAKMLQEGADIIDIGGQSTRPGSARIDAATEIERVLPVIRSILKDFPDTCISIDTYHASVARAAVEAGAFLVNDISAGSMDDNMIATVAALRVPYVCMHMRGTPATMQENPLYDQVTLEVLDFFKQKIVECREAGIADVIIDKTIEHNFRLLRELEVFHILDTPLLVGISRKATIYKTLGITADEALNGSTVLHTAALLKGAHILRVHDVKEAVEVVKLVEQLQVSSYKLQDDHI
jgi:dihydropteroate synthase